MSNEYGTIILHYEGMAICEDDFGDLHYCEIPEEYAELGSVIPMDDLESIKVLSLADQLAIRNAVKEIPEDLLEEYRTGSEG